MYYVPKPPFELSVATAHPPVLRCSRSGRPGRGLVSSDAAHPGSKKLAEATQPVHFVMPLPPTIPLTPEDALDAIVRDLGIAEVWWETYVYPAAGEWPAQRQVVLWGRRDGKAMLLCGFDYPDSVGEHHALTLSVRSLYWRHDGKAEIHMLKGLVEARTAARRSDGQTPIESMRNPRLPGADATPTVP